MAVDDQLNGSAPADAAALRAEIAATRAQLGETVEALAMKTDVKARTKDAVNQTVAEAKGRGQTAIDRGKRIVANGLDAAARQRRALAANAGKTAQNPAVVWTAAGVGATVGAGVAAILWLRARNRSTPTSRAVATFERARDRVRR